MWSAGFIDSVKRYLSLEEPHLNQDDLLLEQTIDRAESHLEEWSHRLFKAEKQTRVYDYPADDPYTLLLDGDLQKVIRLTNGDGAVIPATDFVYQPANRGIGNKRKPAFAIQLINDAYFTYASNPTQCIKLRAWWGYSMEPDHYTLQALLRLTCFLYKQKDSQVFDTTSFVDGGVLVIPEGIPKYVSDFLSSRTRIYR